MLLLGYRHTSVSITTRRSDSPFDRLPAPGQYHGIERNAAPYLVSVGAAEHGQLPHRPVSAIIVTGPGIVFTADDTVHVELNAREPAFAQHVVDLLDDIVHGERGEVGKGLESGVVNGAPHMDKECKDWDILKCLEKDNTR